MGINWFKISKKPKEYGIIDRLLIFMQPLILPLLIIVMMILVLCQAKKAEGAEMADIPPIVRIASPRTGDKLEAWQDIEFKGSATDPEDGRLPPDSMVWTSDLDRHIGRGASFSAKLSVGTHIITLTARDSGRNEARDSIFVNVLNPKSKTDSKMIEIKYVPPFGGTGNLKGIVNLTSGDISKFSVRDGKLTSYAVVVYIKVEGRWWIKPSYHRPVTSITAYVHDCNIQARESSTGHWMCDITTGGIDELAKGIVAYLIPVSYEPPLLSGSYSLPNELKDNCIAMAEASRDIPENALEVVSIDRLKGVCYGPFRDNQNPDMGIFPADDEIEEDTGMMAGISKAIRTYGSSGTPGSIPGFCEQAGIDCWPGAWLGKYKTENEKEIDAVISIAGRKLACVKALIVGNEVLLRKDLEEAQLISHIRKVKESTRLPVTTADIWSVWEEHPRLVREVDLIVVHIHPYWEGIPIERAASHVARVWKYMKAMFPAKRVVVGETGWPSKGKTMDKAVPSPENQARFFAEFTAIAEQEGIEYFYFELFDEKWKEKFEGRAGAYWGIYKSDGSLKGHMKGLVPEEAEKGIKRPPGKVSKTVASARLLVYGDADSDNGFQPSGWMGDISCIGFDKECELLPFSGKTCIRISYKSNRGFIGEGWSGIYWQHPLNNWGEYPGYELSGVSRISFWARGNRGGEKSEFKAGGIRNRGKPYRDSFGPVSSGTITLSREWQKYTIDIEGMDTSNVIGGFCWVTNHRQNRLGCTIYLDDISFE